MFPFGLYARIDVCGVYEHRFDIGRVRRMFTSGKGPNMPLQACWCVFICSVPLVRSGGVWVHGIALAFSRSELVRQVGGFASGREIARAVRYIGGKA